MGRSQHSLSPRFCGWGRAATLGSRQHMPLSQSIRELSPSFPMLALPSPPASLWAAELQVFEALRRRKRAGESVRGWVRELAGAQSAACGPQSHPFSINSAGLWESKRALPRPSLLWSWVYLCEILILASTCLPPEGEGSLCTCSAPGKTLKSPLRSKVCRCPYSQQLLNSRQDELMWANETQQQHKGGMKCGLGVQLHILILLGCVCTVQTRLCQKPGKGVVRHWIFACALSVWPCICPRSSLQRVKYCDPPTRCAGSCSRRIWGGEGLGSSIACVGSLCIAWVSTLIQTSVIKQ